MDKTQFLGYFSFYHLNSPKNAFKTIKIQELWNLNETHIRYNSQGKCGNLPLQGGRHFFLETEFQVFSRFFGQIVLSLYVNFNFSQLFLTVSSKTIKGW